MSMGTQCNAMTKTGVRCKNSTKSSNYCRVHTPKTKTPSILKIIKTTGEIVAATNGVILLVTKAVEVFQNLFFGRSPSMPNDYEYLADKIGPRWGSPSDSYRPGMFQRSSVNWSEARRLFDKAEMLRQSGNTTEYELDQIKKDAQRFWESLSEDMQDDIEKKLQAKSRT